MIRFTLLALLLASAPALGQTNGGVGPTDPVSCVSGSQFFNTTSGTLKTCSANVWTAVGGGSFSGAYADLTGKPTLGTAAATAITDYATAAQGALADSALQPAGNGSALTGLTKGQVGLGNVDNTTDAGKPVSTAQQTALNLKANITSQAFVTPALGVATATSLAATGAVTSSGTAGIGYAAGAGCAVTQLTNKATATPACNKVSGEITMNGAALAAATIVSFTLTNNVVGATDVLVLNHVTTGTRGAYTLNAQSSAGSAIIYVRNNTAGSLSEAIVIRFAVIKGATS